MIIFLFRTLLRVGHVVVSPHTLRRVLLLVSILQKLNKRALLIKYQFQGLRT